MPTLMQKLFGLGAVLDFQQRDAVARMGTAERAAGQLRKSLLDVGTGARAGAGGLAQVGLAVSPLTTALGLGVKRAMDFEEGMARIGTLLTGPDLGQLPQIGSDLDAMTRRFGLAADVVQNAGFQALSASVPVRDLGRFLDVAARAAVGGFTQIDVAVDGLTNVLNAYGLGVEYAEQVSDAFFVANRRGKTTVGELASSLGKVAPLARQLGLDFRDLAGTVATVTKSGVATAEVVTGLKAALSNVMKPTSEAAKEAERLGFAFGPDAIRQAGGFLPFLELVRQKTGGSLDSMGKLFSSVEGLNTVLTLTSQEGLADFTAGLQEMAGGGQTEAAFRLAEQSAAFQMRRMQQIGLSALRAVGAAVLPILSEVMQPISAGVEQLTQSLADPNGLGGTLKAIVLDVRRTVDEHVMPAIRKAMEWLGGLGPETKKRLLQGVLALAGMGAAVGTLAAVLGPVVMGLSGIASAAQGAGGALAAMASPATLVAVLAIAAAGTEVAANWDRVRAAAEEFGGGFTDTMRGVARETRENLNPALEQTWQTLRGIFGTILADGTQAKATWGEIGVAAAGLVGVLADLATVVVNVFGFAFNLVAGEIINPFISTLKLQWSGVVDILTGKDVLGGIKRFMEGAVGIILLPFQSLVRRMLDMLASAITAINKSVADSKFGRWLHMENIPLWGNIPGLAQGFNDIYGGPLPFSLADYAPGAREAKAAMSGSAGGAGESEGEGEGDFEERVAAAVQRGAAAGTAQGAAAGIKAAGPAPVHLDGRALDRAAGRRAAADRDRTGTPVSPSERAYYLRGHLLVAHGAAR